MSKTCPNCKKVIESEIVSQDIQLYFDNINHLLELSEKSQGMLDAIKESNRETDSFASSLLSGHEEVKEIS